MLKSDLRWKTRCACIEKVEIHGELTGVEFGFLSDEKGPCGIGMSFKIKPHKRGGARRVMATHCPFCGAELS